MKMIEAPSPLALAVGILIAMLVLGAGSCGLDALARPPDYGARLAAVEDALVEIEREAPGTQAAPFGERTLCSGAVLAASAMLRDNLVQKSGALGMTVRSLATTPGAKAPALAAIDVAFTAEGPYDGAVRLIGALETSDPEVFVDSLELSPAAGGTRLKMTGRAFCWTSVRR